MCVTYGVVYPLYTLVSHHHSTRTPAAHRGGGAGGGGDVQVIIASGVFRKTQVGIFFLSYNVQRLQINN